MISLLEFKSKIQKVYQRYSIYIEPVFKFIVAIIVFSIINNNIGYDERLKSLPIVLALSLVCAFLPSSVLVLLSILVTLLHVFYVSPILAFILLVILLIMYFLYLHFTPDLGFVLIAIPILYFLKIPYVMPILLGLFFTPISIIASAFGIIFVYLLKIIVDVVNMQFGNTVEDILQIYTYVTKSLTSNQEMITTIIVFSLIILVTYIIRRLKINFAFEAAVGIGAITCIVGFLIFDLRLGITEQIGPMILGTLISAIIVLVIQFFYRALDYSRSEHVQFEDDEYYYYVKAVPKIKVAEQKINIKRINPQRHQRNSHREDEERNNRDFDNDLYNDDEEDLFFEEFEK